MNGPTKTTSRTSQNGRRRCARSRARAARRLCQLLDLRLPRIRASRENAHGANRASGRSGVTLNTRAKWPLMWLSTCPHGALPVLTLDRPREYPRGSCAALGLDLGQADAGNGRRHRDRPHLVGRRKTRSDLLDRLDRQRHSQHGGHRGM